MKKFISLIIIAVSVMAASSVAAAGFEVGLINSRYVYAGYRFNPYVGVSLRHSLNSEKFGRQEIGGNLTWYLSEGHWSMSATGYGGSAWDGSYYNAGLRVGAAYRFPKVVTLFGAIDPYYDSGYGYTTCFRAGAEAAVTNEIALSASYTTIPDYRKSEKRIHAGVKFSVGTLWVEPKVSVPVGDANKFKNMRVLVSMSYTFPKVL